jgi:valyl-tRNA synthetase
MKLLVPMAGLIDAAAEIARLDKQRRSWSPISARRAPSSTSRRSSTTPRRGRRQGAPAAEELGSAIANLEQQLERVRALA